MSYFFQQSSLLSYLAFFMEEIHVDIRAKPSSVWNWKYKNSRRAILLRCACPSATALACLAIMAGIGRFRSEYSLYEYIGGFWNVSFSGDSCSMSGLKSELKSYAQCSEKPELENNNRYVKSRPMPYWFSFVLAALRERCLTTFTIEPARCA